MNTTTIRPITVFSVEDFGMPIPQFVQANAPLFYDLPLDPYDAKKEQIMLLQSTLDLNCTDILYKYYLGELDFSAIEQYYKMLPEKKQVEFDKIKPYRRRGVSRYSCNKSSSGWNARRIPTKPFSQTYAKISENHFDIRALPRIFTEIDEKSVSSDMFKTLLFGLIGKIAEYHPDISELDITVHHVLVETTKERVTSNSPEGIHQDGYDYIVSALVVERCAILGGESQIFDDDKTTKILTTTLQPGHGILQPDKDTHLWHKVTPIYVKEGMDIGFRSSIGFDIGLVR